MPGNHSSSDVTMQWFPLDQAQTESGLTLKAKVRSPQPIAQESVAYRRGWTCERDLVGGSPDDGGSYWRRPTRIEMKNLDLEVKIADDELEEGIVEKRWLINVGKEPGLPPVKMAVLFTERVVR